MESQGLAELRLIFFGKKHPRGAKNGSRNPLNPNEVAPVEDLLLPRPDGGAARPLFSRSGRGQDQRGDRLGVARLARSEPRPGTRDVLSPSRPLDLDPAARRPRARRTGVRGHGRRLRCQQPAGQSQRSAALLSPLAVAQAPLFSAARLDPARARLRRRLRDLLLPSGDERRRDPFGRLRQDRPAGGGAGLARRGRCLRGLPAHANRASHGSLLAMSAGVTRSGGSARIVLPAAVLALLVAAVVFAVFRRTQTERLMELVWRRLPERFQPRAREFALTFVDGFASLKSPGLLLSIVAGSLAMWFVINVQIYFVLKAFALPLPLSAAYVVTAAAVLGLAVPTPGGLGSYQVAVQIALTDVFSVTPTTATSVALVAWATSFVFITLLGLGFFLFSFRTVHLRDVPGPKQSS